MNSIKRMVLGLILLTLCSIAHGDEARTGDGRVLENPTSNGDLKLRVNVGGTKRDPIIITGASGALTLGPTGTTQTIVHSVLGRTVSQSSDSTLGVRYEFTSSSTNGRTWTIGHNFITGVGEFSIFDNTANAERFKIDTSGGATIGTSGSNATSQLNGNALIVRSGAGNSASVRLSPNGTVQSVFGNNITGDNFITGASANDLTIVSNGNGISFSGDSGSSLQGRMSSAGAWTLGPPSGGVSHTIRSGNTSGGSLFILSTAGSDQSGGYLGIQKVSNDSTTAQTFLRFFINTSTQNGGIQGNGGTGVQFFAGSDRRIKQDITDLTGALDKVNSLQPRKFHLKRNPSGPLLTDFIAQEFNDVFPEQVGKPDDGTGDTVDDEHTWTMSHDGLVVYLVGAVKELKAQHDAIAADYAAYKLAHP